MNNSLHGIGRFGRNCSSVSYLPISGNFIFLGETIFFETESWYDIDSAAVYLLLQNNPMQFIENINIDHETVGDIEIYSFSYLFTESNIVDSRCCLGFVPIGAELGEQTIFTPFFSILRNVSNGV